MFTKRETKYAADIVARIAQENNVPESQVRMDIKEAIDTGRRNSDPAVQARWAESRYADNETTVEEFILWAAAQVKGRIN